MGALGAAAVVLFNEAEIVLEVLGVAAVGNFFAKKVLFAKDRDQTVEQIRYGSCLCPHPLPAELSIACNILQDYTYFKPSLVLLDYVKQVEAKCLNRRLMPAGLSMACNSFRQYIFQVISYFIMRSKVRQKAYGLGLTCKLAGSIDTCIPVSFPMLCHMAGMHHFLQRTLVPVSLLYAKLALPFLE